MQHIEPFEHTRTQSNVVKLARALEQAQAAAYFTRAGDAHLHLWQQLDTIWAFLQYSILLSLKTA